MRNLLVIGGGVMGSAIIKSIITHNILHKENIFIRDKDEDKTKKLKDELGISCGQDQDEYDVIVLAVKPQQVEAITLPRCKMLISILAGTSTDKLSKLFGSNKICRVMPNTPLLVNKGLAGIFCTTALSEEEKAFCQKLFSASSKIINLDNEDQMHSVTALSGSGPAYFFAFVEAMEEAGQELGFSASDSRAIVMQTLLGATALLKSSGQTASTLRQNVSSKGGTTEAALKVLTDNNFSDLVKKAILAAKKRSEDF